MNQLRRLLKLAKISSTQLAEAMDIPIRTLSYQYSTGRMPYALVYKLHLVTGVPMDQIVPKFLAENWLFVLEEQSKLNKPRGKQKAWSPTSDKPKRKPKAPKEPELPAPHVPRETTLPNSISPPLPDSIRQQETVTPKPKTDVPKQTPAAAKRSIADIMKSSPAPTPEPDVDAPDFSNLDDSIFSTSADQNPARKRR